jgi:DNA-binding CsgD family transcriptional regulator/tetratricopeptide (TPR) repeat protein
MIDTAHELVGRHAEMERLHALVNRLHEGGGALVISGEAGIGKSAMLGHVREHAQAMGTTVLATAGVESEAELGFAGLHQLLFPIIGAVDLLADAQRLALEAAFGLATDIDPDPFRVALAAFQLISDTADVHPVVLLVDDAHWLDRPTLDVLAFIARRLEHVPMALVATVRSGYASPFKDARLPLLELSRLSAGEAGALLDRSAPGLHPVSRARLLAEAAGNPLALVELPRTASFLDSPPPDRLVPAPTALNARLEQAFAVSLRDLADDSRLALLAVALDSRASLDEIGRAATLVQGSQVSREALEPAVLAGLVDVHGGGAQYRHPLIRSAVRQAAPALQVLAMYGALATVVDDPERRVWHRAMAATGSDEDVAVALEELAQASVRRGAVAVAGAALERAAALSAEPRKKSERLLAAAEAAHELGLIDDVRRLLDQVSLPDLGRSAAARLAWLNEVISGDVWFETGATKTFVTLAHEMAASGDADMALRSLLPIAHRCWWTNPQPRTRRYLVDAARQLGTGDDDPRLLAVIAMADPEAEGQSVLKHAYRLKRAQLSDPASEMLIGIAAEKSGDFATGARLLAGAVDGLRAQVRLGPLTQALVHHAWAATQTGDWSAAVTSGEEAASLARDTRQPQYGVTGELMAAYATALLGNAPDLDATLAASERKVRSIKSTPLLTMVHLARGAAALGEGRYDEAFRHLRPVFDEDSGVFHRFMRWNATLDIAEAAARSGHAESLVAVIADLEDVVTRSAPPALCLQLACARPLLAPDDAAERLFAAALSNDLSPYPFLQARTLFSYGGWLRRQRHSAGSRQPLRRSIELFDLLGAAAWAQRARQELRATGETVGPRTPDARDRLSAQELQIARLAAAGLSNRDIGERLFLSHRTIGSHLYRIYPKLGITGRGHLRESLASTVGD